MLRVASSLFVAEEEDLELSIKNADATGTGKLMVLLGAGVPLQVPTLSFLSLRTFLTCFFSFSVAVSSDSRLLTGRTSSSSTVSGATGDSGWSGSSPSIERRTGVCV